MLKSGDWNGEDPFYQDLICLPNAYRDIIIQHKLPMFALSAHTSQSLGENEDGTQLILANIITHYRCPPQSLFNYKLPNTQPLTHAVIVQSHSKQPDVWQLNICRLAKEPNPHFGFRRGRRSPQMLNFCRVGDNFGLSTWPDVSGIKQGLS